jgi:hypothetical protein
MISANQSWLRFVVVILATWRVTHLLANEDGPGDVIVRVRVWLGNGFLGQLADCFQCLSLWVAAPLALVTTREPLARALTWLAISGAACLLERGDTTKGELLNGMLWRETDSDQQFVDARASVDSEGADAFTGSGAAAAGSYTDTRAAAAGSA